jgi:hypothetical protein
MHLGRWKKPRLYLTIAGTSQLLSLGLAFLFFSIGLESWQDIFDILQGGPHGWLLVLSVPTVTAAISLFQARKLGIFISLALMPLLGFALGMSVFLVLGQSGIAMLEKVLIDLSIASVMAMLGPLILGWKRMPWKMIRKRSRRKKSTALLVR